MVPLQHQPRCCLIQVLLLYLLFLISVAPALISSHSQLQRRLLLDLGETQDDPISINKKPNPINTTTKISSNNQTKSIKPTPTSSKNQTNLIKPSSSSPKNQTKLIQPSPISSKNHTKPSPTSSKNQTKLVKDAFKNQTKAMESKPSDPAKNKSKPTKATSNPKTAPLAKSRTKKLNSTSNSATKVGSISPKKSTDLPKNKTIKETKSLSKTSATKLKSKTPIKAHSPPDQFDPEDDDDLISDFRDLPYKFHETFVPDLERISQTSRMYLTNYNKEITKGFKPYVGNKYAPTVASIASFAFIIIPLILVSVIFNRITAYFSIQKILIFIQFYLAMYFAILGLSTLVTGVEPLKFFYSAAQSVYVGVQVLQTVGYVLYLMLLLMYLIVSSSSETGLGVKLWALAQTFVGFAVGLHYYVTVFHRAVLHQQPKSSWKAHSLYATCFLAVCLLGTAWRRKKTYLEEGGQEGKQS